MPPETPPNPPNLSDPLFQIHRTERWLRIRRFVRRILPALLLGLLMLFLFYLLALSAPFGFPDGAYVKVPEGSSIAEVAAKLKERNIVRSVFIFEAAARLSGQKVIAGEYYFESRENIFSVASRLAHGEYDIEPIRVTVPEGANVFEIARLLSKSLPDFDDKAFLELAEPREGYLFPDTYFFYPGAEADLIVQTMESNFSKNVAKISTSTVLLQKPFEEVLVMASLLEEEAPYLEDRQIIAGILWRRIEIDMPLQVDAVFPYIIGKNSFTLTKEDLKTDSPYNTYVNKGLPPGPITNPGLDAIYAALTPKKSTYLYYLSDLDGNFHYCSTYVCHVDNKAKYLGT